MAGSSRVSTPESRAEDAALVARIASGDQKAVGLLYDRYSSILLAVGVRVLGARREAEDLLHDVFLEVWRRAADYNPDRGSVRVWLCMRMRSRALDRIRSAGRAPNVSTEEAKIPEAVHPGEDPSVTADRAVVRRALGALPEEQRVVLLLGYFEGLSSSEIAEKLDLPIGTVKSRVAAGLKKLRAALGDNPSPEPKKGANA